MTKTKEEEQVLKRKKGKRSANGRRNKPAYTRNLPPNSWVTLTDDALDVGIPTESRRTGADGLVADGKALGILAAVAIVAGILALTTDAGLVEGAVAIAATALCMRHSKKINNLAFQCTIPHLCPF